MPHPNYRNLSVTKDVYWKLQRLAKEQGISISQLLNSLLENVNPVNPQPTQALTNQEKCEEQTKKHQINTHFSMEFQNNKQNENVVGNNENLTDCPFNDTCPFTDPEYIKRHGFIYKPEVSSCYISSQEKSKVKTSQDKDKTELLDAILEGLKALEEMEARRK